MAKTIITLGREYCTGGRYIAEDVANALGIKLYDKELITMAAKHSGLSEEAVAASEKRHTHSLLYSLYTMGNELPLGDQVFILQSRIIKQLAEEGPCVILGRCGDYVLRERKDVLRVFVYAPKDWRLEYAKTNPLVKAKDEKGIKEEVEKTDRPLGLLQLLHPEPLGRCPQLRSGHQRSPRPRDLREDDPGRSRRQGEEPWLTARALQNKTTMIRG